MSGKHYDNEMLAAVRERMGYSRADVAAKLGVTDMTIGRVERGTNASMDILHALADLYSLPIASILRARPLEEAAA